MSPSELQEEIRTVQIGSHRVGEGEPAFVIAEAGVNHDGSMGRALQMVDVAARGGADAVKFQLFSAKDLVTRRGPTAAYQLNATGDASQQAMLSRLELSDDACHQIRDRCKARSIMFLATPFGLFEVDRAVSLGVDAIKIASTDLTHTALLERAVTTSLPIILSTGASTEAEIRDAVTHIQTLGGGDRLILLHCVSRYPTPISAINLRSVSVLHHMFGVPTGLSDHTTEVDVGALAVAAGAGIIEKHFTLDPGATGPDHAMSLSPTQLGGYIAAIRRGESAMGRNEIGLTPEEHDVRTTATRSVVAAKDIPIGSVLTADMLTIKRPGTGIPAGAIQELIGRRACAPIKIDTTITWAMVR